MGDAGPNDTVTASAVIRLSGVPFQVEITVPTRAVDLGELLPTFRSLTGMIIDKAVADEAAEGRAVSCRKGCGACCRQVVPIAEVEARRIHELVEALPEPRRSKIRARFADAIRRLQASGILDKLLHLDRLSIEGGLTLGLDYFHQGIPCPFLEDESCSIHEERPLACREYLVTSPAEHCARPTAETVRCVPLAGKSASALRKVGLAGDPPGAGPWVPLVLALDWAEQHPEGSPPRPGPEWIGEFIRQLTGRNVPSPPKAGPA